MRSAVISLLFSRFEKVDPSLVVRLNQFNDINMLSTLVIAMVKVNSLKEARSLIERSFSKIQ